MDQPELRDIHLPEASLWWPPAAGWWIALAALVCLGLLLPWLWRRWRNWMAQRPLGRVSLRELERIRRDYKESQSERDLLDRVATLLRRVTISYCGRRGPAATTGERWAAQLQRLAPGAEFPPPLLDLLTRDRYRADCAIDAEALLLACERWLRALRRRDHVSA